METLIYVGLATGCLALVTASGTLTWVLARSLPAQLQRAVRQAAQIAQDVDARMSALELRIAGWKAELAGLSEEVVDQLEKAEKKRASARTAQQRAEQAAAGGAGGVPVEQMDRDSVVSEFRRQLYGAGRS